MFDYFDYNLEEFEEETDPEFLYYAFKRNKEEKIRERCFKLFEEFDNFM
jgi:hypothetical protein